MFGVWVKSLEFAGILFINGKDASKEAVPEVSIIRLSEAFSGEKIHQI